MLNSIESKIHDILLDIDPSLHKDYEEQAIVVAESTANYRIATSKQNIRKSSVSNDEAIMIDCILQAMDTMVKTHVPKYSYASYFVQSDEELDYETVLRNLRFSSQDIDVMNDDDLNSFLENQEDSDPYFKIADIFDDQRPNSELYQSKGQKKHRSDSQAR